MKQMTLTFEHVNGIYDIRGLNVQNHMIISKDTQKVLNGLKCHHPFMI